jgi:protein-tyrosine-phosphatase/thioredoxin reductase
MTNNSVIFVCVHNSARSQMAEAFLKKHGADLFSRVESGGIEAGTLNPLVVKSMAEVGIDISKNRAKQALEFVKTGTHFGYVITVCDAANAERCPTFPGINVRIQWNFPDPSRLTGPEPEEEKLGVIRGIRNDIEATIKRWCDSIRKDGYPKLQDEENMNSEQKVFELAILGAGPVGLAAAAQAVRRGIHPLILEAGSEIAANLRNVAHVRLFSPWRYDVDQAAQELLVEVGWQSPDLDTLPTAGQLVDRYLVPLSRLPQIRDGLRLNQKVTYITRLGADKVKTSGREEAVFLIRAISEEGETEYRARAIIDATGTWNQPNPLGGHGVPARGEGRLRPRLVFGMPDILNKDRARFAGKRVLVVGSGHSAAGNLIALSTLVEDDPRTSVVWAVRGQDASLVFGGGDADDLPARGELGTKLKSLRDGGRLELYTEFVVAELADHGKLTVTAEDGRAVTVDEVIVSTGSRPNLEIERELRLQLDPWLESTQALAPLIDPNVHSCGTVPPHGHRELQHPEKGFYVAGTKSYGRAPNFLLATGYEQVRSIVAALAGDFEAADHVQLVLPTTGVCSSDSAGASCCGGPAPAGQDACCAQDAEAKAAGESGCGCGCSTPAKVGTFDLLGIPRL